jgi:hypothetical protein
MAVICVLALMSIAPRAQGSRAILLVVNKIDVTRRPCRERISHFGPIINRSAVSPDGSWVVLYASQRDMNPATYAVPLNGNGREPRKICRNLCGVWWSGDGTTLFVNVPDERTIVVPIPHGQTLPEFPEDGVGAPPDRLVIEGLRVLREIDVVPGRDPSTYVYGKSETRRNLYRIPLP